MKYCNECGGKLVLKQDKNEGLVNYCCHCQQFKYELFNSAISAIVFNPTKDKILLISQYGKKDRILVAGYINKGENAKEALIREIKEEINLDVVSFRYNDNEYYQPTNTLIHNYAVVVDKEEYILNEEVDSAKWYTIDEAIKNIKNESLAQSFLIRYINKIAPK